MKQTEFDDLVFVFIDAAEDLAYENLWHREVAGGSVSVGGRGTGNRPIGELSDKHARGQLDQCVTLGPEADF